jgi:uncharacterized protein (DUF1778 family)
MAGRSKSDAKLGCDDMEAATHFMLRVYTIVLTLSGRQLILHALGAIMASRVTRSEKLDLRLTPDAKMALQTAAAASNRSVSEFVLESALARADEALADRRNFGLNAVQWKEFMAALDAPPRPLPRLERLLKEPGFFDAGTHQ